MEEIKAGLNQVYALANELSAKSEAVQVATLLTVVGEEAREVFSTFSNWEHDGDEGKIGPVLEKFEKYCQPRKHVPFERYRFNRGTQEAGETYDQYRTALRKLSEGCESPDEILRDRLVFGIRDVHVRGRMLRESGLTLKRTDEICHAAESLTVQLKQVEDSSDSGVSDNGVSAVAGNTETQQFEKPAEPKRIRECWNYGQRHEFQKELCPAYGKTCRKCRKPNHFAVKYRSRAAPSSVKAVEDRQEPGSADETFLMEVAMVTLDDSQFVTLRLKSGNHIRFQVDTGAQCNVVPLKVYKKATKDVTLACVTPSHSRITAYGGDTLPVVETVLLQVWRGTFRCRLDCKIVDRSDIQPLLGRKACIGMKIVTYLDNDKINKPNTSNAHLWGQRQRKSLPRNILTYLGKEWISWKASTISSWTAVSPQCSTHQGGCQSH